MSRSGAITIKWKEPSEVPIFAISQIKHMTQKSTRTLKDGYESDSTLSYRKHCYTPTNSGPSPQAKALYTQVKSLASFDLTFLEGAEGGRRASAGSKDAST